MSKRSRGRNRWKRSVNNRGRQRQPGRSALRLEALESRHLLATTVTTLEDVTDGSIDDGTVSLRDAIALAPAGDTINFDGVFDFSQPLMLTMGELAIAKNLTIQGPGHDLLTISAGGNSRIFNIADGNVAGAVVLSPSVT